MQNLVDWVTNPTVAVSYGGVAIGQNGLIQSPALSGVTGVALSGAVGARSLTVVGKQGITLSQVNAAQGVKR
jgi:hypothetical protein